MSSVSERFSEAGFNDPEKIMELVVRGRKLLEGNIFEDVDAELMTKVMVAHQLAILQGMAELVERVRALEP